MGLWRRTIKWACKQAQSMAGTVGCQLSIFPQFVLPFFIVYIKLLESFFVCSWPWIEKSATFIIGDCWFIWSVRGAGLNVRAHFWWSDKLEWVWWERGCYILVYILLHAHVVGGWRRHLRSFLNFFSRAPVNLQFPILISFEFHHWCKNQ